MSGWQGYQVVLRLVSPMHVGQHRLGNVRLTRGYVPARLWWAALTARLTRQTRQGDASSPSAEDYSQMGKRVHETMALGYLYPALRTEQGWQVFYPWDDAMTFRARFLSSYASTALIYPQQSAAQGSLHEVEFLAPQTRSIDGKESEAVYLVGNVWVREDAPAWRTVLPYLQFGGERGYGWGRIALMEVTESTRWGHHEIISGRGRPVVQVAAGGTLLAHTPAREVQAVGSIEALVGRQWTQEGPGRTVEPFGGICYEPGSRVEQESYFTVGAYGLWLPPAD